MSGGSDNPAAGLLERAVWLYVCLIILVPPVVVGVVVVGGVMLAARGFWEVVLWAADKLEGSERGGCT